MRSQKDIESSNGFNETKAPILFLLVEAEKNNIFLTSLEIAEALGMTNNNASKRLSILFKKKYIYRRNVGKKCYLYQHLRNKGRRVCRRLWIRQELKNRTNDERINLNIRKPLPAEYATDYELIQLQEEIEQEYNFWLYSPPAA